MEDRDRMTAKNLTIFFADMFHDWIDGDDSVIDYHRLLVNEGTGLWVLFESGAQFKVSIEEVFE